MMISFAKVAQRCLLLWLEITIYLKTVRFCTRLWCVLWLMLFMQFVFVVPNAIESYLKDIDSLMVCNDMWRKIYYDGALYHCNWSAYFSFPYFLIVEWVDSLAKTMGFWKYEYYQGLGLRFGPYYVFGIWLSILASSMMFAGNLKKKWLIVALCLNFLVCLPVSSCRYDLDGIHDALDEAQCPVVRHFDWWNSLLYRYN